LSITASSSDLSLLKVFQYSSPVRLAVITPATIESLTLRAVLAISTTGSIAIKTPKTVTGRLREPKTIRVVNVAPPPTPATPKLEITSITTKLKTNCHEKMLTPTSGAVIAIDPV